MRLPHPSLALAVVVSLLVCVGCADREAQRPLAADGLAKACAQCDSRGMLDGAICYGRLAEKLLGEGKRGLAEAKLIIAAEKMTAALAEEGDAPPYRAIDTISHLEPGQKKSVAVPDDVNIRMTYRDPDDVVWLRRFVGVDYIVERADGTK